MLIKSNYNFYLYMIAIVLSIGALIISNAIVINDFDDNLYYHLAFNHIDNMLILENYNQFKLDIGHGAEPIYFLFNYIFKDVIEFNSLILIINIFFLYSVFNVLKKFFKYYLLIYIILLLSNNYIYVLLSDPHRVKLAISFFLLYLVSVRYKSILLILSILTHFQMLIFIVYKFMILIFDKIKDKGSFLLSNLQIFVLLCFFILYYITYDSFGYTYIYLPIYNKIVVYSDTFKINLNTVVFTWFYIYYICYIHYFKLNNTQKLFYPLLIVLFSISFILNFYRIQLLLLILIFVIELNRLFDGKRYAVLIVLPLIIYNFYNLVKFLIKGLGLE